MVILVSEKVENSDFLLNSVLVELLDVSDEVKIAVVAEEGKSFPVPHLSLSLEVEAGVFGADLLLLQMNVSRL